MHCSLKHLCVCYVRGSAAPTGSVAEINLSEAVLTDSGYLASWGGMRATAAAAAVAIVERSTAHIVDSRSVVGRATTFVVNIDMPRKC